jgi:two-component system repressor protein LuxO
LNNGITVSIDMLPEEVKETIQSEALTSTQLQEGADYRPDSILGTMADIRPLWVSEKEEITKAIKLCDGNVPKAAAMLDVSPSTLYRKKQSWDSK